MDLSTESCQILPISSKQFPLLSNLFFYSLYSFLKRFYVCRRNGTRGTLSSDFQTKLDNLLKTLMHSKPHFVLCLKVKKKSKNSRKSEKTDNNIDLYFSKLNCNKLLLFSPMTEGKWTSLMGT